MDKVLSSDNVKFLIQIMATVVAMTLAYAAITTDVSLIKRDIDIIHSNHLTHIQADITEIRENYKDQTKILNEMMILIKSTHR